MIEQGEPAFASAAERVVWEALRSGLPAGAAVLTDLHFSDRSQDRRADVLVLWPGVGVAVIGVEGVGQAVKCKYLLRAYLRRHPRWLHQDPRLVHMVAFPNASVPADLVAPDGERWRVIDRGDLPGAAESVRSALVHPDPLADAGWAPDEAGVAELVDVLTGALSPQRALIDSLEAAERGQSVDLLTADQARVLDHLRAAPRVEIRGGAGSGKTWLAVEQARRLTLAGRRVGLLCSSRGLASYLERRVAGLRRDERPAYVGTFHGLGSAWPDADRFDAFVVDEAHDFSDTWWPALLTSMRDPASGGLYVFTDEGLPVSARQGRPPVEPTPITLDENLRNTQEIAEVFGSLVRGRMRYRGGHGAPVRFIACATADAIGVADEESLALLESGWSHQHVALLTTGRRHPMQVELQAEGQADYWRSFWEGDDLFFGHVLGFEGLERPAVVLAVNGFQTRARAAEMLYVGLSRARDALVVCGDPDLIAEVGGPAVARRLGLGL